MKTLIPGHRYILDSFEGSEPQTIQFIQKEKQGDEFVTVHDGTTNEEVLTVLIDRMGFLQRLCPSPDNETAIDSLQLALAALNHRTEERKARGVEGTPVK